MSEKKIKLSARKLRQLIPVMEKVTEAFQENKEIKFFVSSLSPSSLFKDLWIVRSALGWSGKVRFKKKEDGVEIVVYAQTAAIMDIADIKELVAEKEKEKSSPSTPAIHTISDFLPVKDLASQLVELKDKGVKSIRLSTSYLSEVDLKKIEKVYEYLKYSPQVDGSWTILTLQEET